MSRWQRFCWAWSLARRAGRSIIESYRFARRFAQNRGQITRQQRRAYARQLRD